MSAKLAFRLERILSHDQHKHSHQITTVQQFLVKMYLVFFQKYVLLFGPLTQIHWLQIILREHYLAHGNNMNSFIWCTILPYLLNWKAVQCVELHENIPAFSRFWINSSAMDRY